ncbi:MAG: MurR/RpiR family transcriptional regulator [Deltaproteobacteria bacterium]|nr:MurR/RpiR family transcriptional regulator [Deltaproteobacteria bacterium]
MPNNRPESLIKIENSLRSLKEAEKKAAEFILANAQRVVDMTISDVAQESGVSESTVFRLCRALDFPGFRAFKLDLARQGAVSMERPFEPVAADDNAEAIAFKVISITVESLQDTLQLLDYDALERAYQALRDARKVLVIALSVSRTTAIFAADKLNFAGIDARAEVDVHFQAMRATSLGPGDVLLAFSRSGDTRDIIEAVQAAKKAGAITIGVVNNPRSFFAKLVDIRLLTKSKETRFRNDLLASRIEHTAVVDVLFTMLAARDSERVAQHYQVMHDAALSKQY